MSRKLWLLVLSCLILFVTSHSEKELSKNDTGPVALPGTSFISTSAPPRSPALQSEPMLTLSPTKEHFLLGEPIGLRLTIRNDTLRDMAFGDDYPTYQFILAGEICFSEKEGRLIYLPIERSDFGGKRSIACVPRGEKWETTIYMQRFVEQPEVGNYHVSYTVKLPYWWQYKNAVGTEMTDDGGYVTGGGSLSFSVTPSTRDQLSKIAKNYESQLSSDDYRQARIAEEALCVMSDSVVVPYLVRLAYWCRSWHLTSEALARFANDENARPVVVGYLSSKDPHAVMGALLVLAKWNIKLTEEEIRKVLKVNGHQINEAIENYVHRIEGRADSNMR